MPRFFVRRDQIDGESVYIRGEDAHHVSRSLRMAAGEHVTVCDMQGVEYDCELCDFSDGEVRARILTCRPADNEPCVFVRLFQALPKGDKLDTVIQKAVECGAGEIVPFESERCVARAKPDTEERKTQRRSRIAEEAAKQCGRSIIPDVRSTVSFEGMLALAAQSDLCLFCYEGDGTEPLGRVLSEFFTRERCKNESERPSVSVVIGSEGGFSLDEAARARASGFVMAGLGRRILRTETASGFVLASIVCLSELC